ncbi:MAG: DNA alkylation repair protein [Methanomicrobia archaeon]|nr:DNA alkylation repair protein [Methanomicrobia archaeon]HDM22594.1 hypothetical protein [Methanomicrobia archaeon]
MNEMKTGEIRDLGKEVSDMISDDEINRAIEILSPILNTKVSFSKLDLLGKEIGARGYTQAQKFFRAFDEIIDYDAMGGFVIVSQALIYFLGDKFEEVMEKNREYIIKGDKWYVCDIFGERSLGHALVNYFDKTLPYLKKFLEDNNKWIKRSVGVSIHFFSKRVLNDTEKTRKLLELLEPHIEEKQRDAVKGIGWGLKTIGKYHPEILFEFLKKQLHKKKLSKLMLRKALTYLDKDKILEIESYVRGL